MRVIPFNMDHLAALNARNKAFVMETTHLESLNIIAGQPAFSILRDGNIHLSAGILPLWKGSGEIWVVSSLCPLGPDLWKFIKLVRFYLKFLRDELDLNRIQGTVKEDFKEGHIFAKAFRFKDEGLMSKYGIDGSDYRRYALCR